jgi:hypothetical protein
MNANKHSPAPWSIGTEYQNSMDEIEDAEGRTLAVVWTRRAPERATARPQFKDCEKGMANARLIACAPELYALVRAYATTYPLDEYQDVARALLAKVEGREA